MTEARITARNRANARSSTGPRTAAGKAVVAGNARRHGATGRPDPQEVAMWLAIILDTPEISPNALVPDDIYGQRALALAYAEARLVSCVRAYDAFEAGNVPDDIDTVFETSEVQLSRELLDSPHFGKLDKRMRELIQGIARDAPSAKAVDAGRRGCLERYLREARAARKKAFTAWCEVRRERQPARP